MFFHQSLYNYWYLAAPILNNSVEIYYPNLLSALGIETSAGTVMTKARYHIVNTPAYGIQKIINIEPQYHAPRRSPSMVMWFRVWINSNLQETNQKTWQMTPCVNIAWSRVYSGWNKHNDNPINIKLKSSDKLQTLFTIQLYYIRFVITHPWNMGRWTHRRRNIIISELYSKRRAVIIFVTSSVYFSCHGC